MDSALSQLLAFPAHPPPTPPLSDADYDKQAKAHCQALSKLTPQRLVSPSKGGEHPLDILNPSINSISYLRVLIALAIVQNKKTFEIADAYQPGSPLWAKALDFIDHFDPVQIRYSGNEMKCLIEATTSVALGLRQPAAAIAPVRTAILRIDPSGATFTSSHPFLPQLCLLAQDYTAALPLLDLDIYHFPTTTPKVTQDSADPLSPFLCSNHESSSTYINNVTGLTGKIEDHEHLQYFLCGAMCYMAIKDWERALLFLEIVMVSPTANTASKIQVDAYKKWVLVSLLHQGKVPSVPKTTNTQASKMFQQLGKPYIGLADVFADGIRKEESVANLVAEATAGNSIWTEDCNSGLVRQVLHTYRKYSILQLQSTYAALFISEVTRRTSPDVNDYAETAQYVIQLINTGQLNATISKPGEEPSLWVLRFTDAQAKASKNRSEDKQLKDLSRQITKVKSIMSHVQESERKYGLNKSYVQEAKKMKKDAPNGGGDGNVWSGQMDGLELDQDEDVMAEM